MPISDLPTGRHFWGRHFRTCYDLRILDKKKGDQLQKEAKPAQVIDNLHPTKDGKASE